MNENAIPVNGMFCYRIEIQNANAGDIGLDADAQLW
jgi:hypothetical protein